MISAGTALLPGRETEEFSILCWPGCVGMCQGLKGLHSQGARNSWVLRSCSIIDKRIHVWQKYKAFFSHFTTFKFPEVQ